jgi:hypothetical protein
MAKASRLVGGPPKFSAAIQEGAIEGEALADAFVEEREAIKVPSTQAEIGKLILTISMGGKRNQEIGSVWWEHNRVAVSVNESFLRSGLNWVVQFQRAVKQINWEIEHRYELPDPESNGHLIEAELKGDQVAMRYGAFQALANVICYESRGRVRLCGSELLNCQQEDD